MSSFILKTPTILLKQNKLSMFDKLVSIYNYSHTAKYNGTEKNNNITILFTKYTDRRLNRLSNNSG